MDKDKINDFLSLVALFKEKNFQLFLVGGTVRDFLLHQPLEDMDVATDATPLQMRTFLNSNYLDLTFAKFGVVQYQQNKTKFDIATLRKEKKYKDGRHPDKIKFITSIKKDHKRRDFTINAIYMDDRFAIYDFEHGQQDIKDKIIRMVGSPNRRIKEDPLRILRAIRFSLVLDFTLDAKLQQAIDKNIDLLKTINPQKIKQELDKIGSVDPEKEKTIFARFNILYLLDMIK